MSGSKRKYKYGTKKSTSKRTKRARRSTKSRKPKYSRRYGYKKSRTSISSFNKFLSKTLSSVSSASYINNSVFPPIHDCKMINQFKSVFTAVDGNTDVEIGSINLNTLTGSYLDIGTRMVAMPNYSKVQNPRGKGDLSALYQKYLVPKVKLQVWIKNLATVSDNLQNSANVAIRVGSNNFKRVDAIKVWFETAPSTQTDRATTLQTAYDRGLKVLTLRPLYQDKGGSKTSFSANINIPTYGAVNESRSIGEALTSVFNGSPSNVVKTYIYATDEEGNPLDAGSPSNALSFEMSAVLTQQVTSYRLSDSGV